MHIAFLRLFNMLPHIVLHLCVEMEGLCPAVALADGLDDLQNVRGDGAMCAVVAVVVIAAEVVDEFLFDGLLCVTWHVIIEMFAHADRHLDELVLPIVFTFALRYLVVSGVHR